MTGTRKRSYELTHSGGDRIADPGFSRSARSSICRGLDAVCAAMMPNVVDIPAQQKLRTSFSPLIRQPK